MFHILFIVTFSDQYIFAFNFDLQEVPNVLPGTLARTRWCASVIQPTVTVLAASPCLLWVISPPT